MPLPVVLGTALDKAGQTATARPPAEKLGRYTVDSQVTGALRSAAKATGMGFEVLAAKAAMESGFRPEAQATTSSARGLFQFIDQTWLGVVREHGAAHGLANEAAAISRTGGRYTIADPALRGRILALRDDPELSARMGAEHLKDISDSLSPVLGRKPDATELYLGHFLGVRGATDMLRAGRNDPGMAASQVLPDAARANPAIFRGANGAPLSVQQVMDRLRERVGQTYAQLGLDTPSGPVALDAAALGQPVKSGTPQASEEPRWWGSGAPARVAHTQEQAMVSALVEVFTRMNRIGAMRGGEEGQSLPAGVLEALRDSGAAQGADAAAGARRAYAIGTRP